MRHINVTINGQKYRMSCEDGQEARHLKLAETLEQRIAALRSDFGATLFEDRETGDLLLMVMAALKVCDELHEAKDELASLRDRAKVTQTAVAHALTAAAERIERTTQALNRTVGGGVAIG